MKITLYKIRINQGGYDNTGRYWGTGLPLYHYEYELKGDIREEIRAADRATAKQLVLARLTAKHPNIKFSFYN